MAYFRLYKEAYKNVSTDNTRVQGIGLIDSESVWYFNIIKDQCNLTQNKIYSLAK